MAVVFVPHPGLMRMTRLRRIANALARRLLVRAAPPLPCRYFDAGEIDAVCQTYFRDAGAPGGDWDALRDAHFRLPDWFRHGLDPYGSDYAQQQQRLWQLVAGVDRAYQPKIDEKEHDWSSSDPVRTPGFYARRDALAVTSASDHVLAIGMILKHCGLVAGDWALEYGAGFGQAALTLARLGVHVDTVDISETFNGFVQQQATTFQVPLTPFVGEFGLNPRPGQRYKLIWFYESFHHCVDFVRVTQCLQELLALGGRLILAGEPIVESECDAVPYPWGLRLHSEVVAVVRRQHWFELGFTEAFLLDLFQRAGFVGRRIECEPSAFGRLYVFERPGC